MAYVVEFENATANGFHIIIVQQGNREFVFFCNIGANHESMRQGYLGVFGFCEL